MGINDDIVMAAAAVLKRFDEVDEKSDKTRDEKTDETSDKSAFALCLNNGEGFFPRVMQVCQSEEITKTSLLASKRMKRTV